MPTESRAVQLLGDLGLTEYEARCYVALSRVSTATASEISDLSEVPRSRVYDAVDRLHRRGLVDVQQSDPREYRALSHDAALATLREHYESLLEAAAEALSGLNREPLEEGGTWAIASHEHVTDRIGAFLADATTEVYVVVADERTFDRQLTAQLAAVDPDVTVVVEVPSAELAGRVRDAVPSASVTETPLTSEPATLEGARMGRLVMVDRRAVLVSAVTDDPRPDRMAETAIWASGPDHGLVVGLRHVLGARIDARDGGE